MWVDGEYGVGGPRGNRAADELLGERVGETAQVEECLRGRVQGETS